MSDVTQILSAIEQGDPKAAEELLPLVYEELRKLAAAKLAHEKPGQTLQATALVHEAYVRLAGPESESGWKSRGHFFGAAAEAMRRILVDRAREKESQRRGGGLLRHGLDAVGAPPPDSSLDVLAVHEALETLARIDNVGAELIKLRYFIGLTIPEAAEALGISRTTADRYWAYSRAWLHARLEKDVQPDRSQEKH
jgi:RNA polymerase sigma factor (TIGR02999 family)